MNRVLFSLLFAAAILTAVAVGYTAAPKSPFDLPAPPDRLPWMTDAMKAPCSKTEFEYRLAAGSVNPEPFVLCAEFKAIQFLGKPVERGLIVRCDVQPRAGITFVPTSPKYSTYVGNGLHWTCEMARRRFCPNDKTAFVNEKSLYALLYFNGKLIAVRTAEFIKILPPNANEDATIKELLTH